MSLDMWFKNLTSIISNYYSYIQYYDYYTYTHRICTKQSPLNGRLSKLSISLCDAELHYKEHSYTLHNQARIIIHLQSIQICTFSKAWHTCQIIRIYRPRRTLNTHANYTFVQSLNESVNILINAHSQDCQSRACCADILWQLL